MLGGWLDELLDEQPATSERLKMLTAVSWRPYDFLIELLE